MKATSNKIYMAIMGIALIAIGVVFLCNPTATLVSLSWLIGIATILSGFSTFGLWVRTRGLGPGGIFIFFAACLQIIVGLGFLFSEFMIALLPILLAVWLLVEGISMVVRSADYKAFGAKSWWILCILGIILAALGINVLASPIENGGSLVSVILGVGTILMGLVDLAALAGVKIFEKKLRSPWTREGWRRDDSIDEQ